MGRWARAWPLVGLAVALVVPAAQASMLSAPRAYAAALLDTIPVPGSASPISTLPVAMVGPPSGLGVGPDVVRAAESFLVPLSVDLSTFFATHRAPGAGAMSSGYTEIDGSPITQDLWNLTCTDRHVPECEAFAEFITVGGHQELRVGVQLVWRAITVVRPPSAGVETLTGYGATSLMDPSSHPVTVTLTPRQRQRLSAVIESLKGAPGGMCMEDSELFVIAVRAPGEGALMWRASADECPGTLSVTWAGHQAKLDARTCALTRLVRALLPASAHATRFALKSCL